MRLFRTGAGTVIEDAGKAFTTVVQWDDIFRATDPTAFAGEAFERAAAAGDTAAGNAARDLKAPVASQEIWAAGVTYYRSRDARMEESRDAAGGDFYARVYEAERPELFFKSSASRVAGHGEKVRLRSDSHWNVPEPELVLAVNSAGKIFGYTVGNDMSSREIEGENPLYLAQAKVYLGSCALGPGILLSESMPPPETTITLEIVRAGSRAFSGATTLAQLKRRPAQLVDYLFRDNSFPDGALLMTGTGIVPSHGFTLASGDEIRIDIKDVGLLVNTVA